MTTPRPLPTWLTEAAAAHRAHPDTSALSTNRPSSASPASDPAPGQIRRLDAMDAEAAASRLVLIVATDAAAAAAQVVLLTNETEMGSDTDALLPRSATGLAFDLMALTDVTGPAWYVQFGPVIAAIDPRLIHNLADNVAGTPAQGASDPRWDWKQEEHDSLMALIGECARQVIDEDPDSVVDPASLDLAVVSSADLALMVRAAAPLLARRQVCMPYNALRKLVDSPVSPHSPYWESVRCLLELMPRRSDLVVNDTTDVLSLAARASLHDDHLSAALSAAFKQQPASHRSLRLLTLRSLWPGSDVDIDSSQSQGTVREAATGVWEVFISGRRHQLLVQPVEPSAVVEPLACALREASHV